MRSSVFATPIIIFLLSVSGCGDGGSTGSSPDNDPASPAVSINISTPEFKGELPLNRRLTVDVNPMLQASGYAAPFYEKLARDGSSILISATSEVQQADNGESSYKKAYLRIDTNSGDVQWVIKDIAGLTKVLFDENNNAVVVVGMFGADIDYVDVSSENPIYLNSVIPDDQFLNHIMLSDDGSVVVYQIFKVDLVAVESTSDHFAYNLLSGTLNKFPDPPISVNGLILEPRFELMSFGLDGLNSSFLSYPSLSDNGTYVSTEQWWGFSDEGNTSSRIGSVLWNTQTNHWQARGMADGSNEWCWEQGLTSCLQPFSYLLSADGHVQYSQIPNNELFETDRFGVVHGSSMVRSRSEDSTELTIDELENVVVFDVNHNGGLLAFHNVETSVELAEGLTLFSYDSRELVSIATPLLDCPSEDVGVDVESCENPASSVIRYAYFSDGGAHLLVSARSPHDSSIIEYLLDLQSASLYSIPMEFSDYRWSMNRDASVFVTPSEQSNGVYLIARR